MACQPNYFGSMQAVQFAQEDLSVTGFEPAYQVNLYDREPRGPESAHNATEAWRITGAKDADEVLRWVHGRNPAVFTVFAEISDVDGLRYLAFVAGFRPSREVRGLPAGV